MRVVVAVAALASNLVAGDRAAAGTQWLEPGDAGILHDIQLLVDERVLDVPVTVWPKYTQPFETRWLSWLGPWSVNGYYGMLEDHREDVDHPHFLGLRVTVKPFDAVEIGLMRTAQWCGEDRNCDWDTFWNLVTGDDNPGENVDPEEEPGNQIAGWQRESDASCAAARAVLLRHSRIDGRCHAGDAPACGNIMGDKTNRESPGLSGLRRG